MTLAILGRKEIYKMLREKRGTDVKEPKEEKPKTEFPKPLVSKLREIQELPLINIIVTFLILTVLVFGIVLFRSKPNKKRKRDETKIQYSASFANIC